MKFLATIAALLFTTVAAPAAILIFDGPAPLKTFGTERSPRRNRAMVVYDTTGKQVGIINYFGRRGRARQEFLGALPVDGGTLSLQRGSLTILTGAVRETQEAGDFNTKYATFRGRNVSLNPALNITGPRVLSGITRMTSQIGTVIFHSEQSFSLVYHAKLSNAANTANDTFEAAITRARTELENRGYSIPN